MTGTISRKLLGALAFALLLIAAAAGFEAQAQTAPTPQALPPPPASLARVWFLRQFEPGESLDTPMIYINGAPLAPSVPGTIFYRDMAPGTYTFAVDTCGTDVNQEATLQLPPGSSAELEIQSLQSFTPPDCPRGTGTFYVRPVAPRFLQLYLPQLAYLGSR